MRGGWQSEERWSERMDWAVWSAVRKAVSPYCWELWTPNALSETKTAINYSTGTEWTSYRKKTWEERRIEGRRGIEEIYHVWELDTKDLFIHFVLWNVLHCECSWVMEPLLPDYCLSNNEQIWDFKPNVGLLTIMCRFTSISHNMNTTRQC